MSIQIREATPEDVDAVLALWNADADPGRTLIDEPGDVRRFLTTGTGALLIAENDTTLVGTIIAAWDGWRGNLYRLVVRADRRRQGLAHQLVARAEQTLRDRGCPRVTALVHLGLDEAPAFWPAVGYVRDTEVGRFVRNL